MTQKISLAVLARALPLQKNPEHVAEEFAVLDHLSHGRIIAGVQRGLATEYHNSGISPHGSHERFFEATDLIARSWTQPGPFYHTGKHYQLSYVNPWPRPVQQPHPPIWILSQGSEETLRWAAASERRYPVILGLMSAEAAERAATIHHQALDPSTPDPAGSDKLGITVLVHIAETDAKAREQARQHAEYFLRRLFLRPIRQAVPFNYAPLPTLQYLQSEYQRWAGSDKTLETLEALGMLIVGSPTTVQERLSAHLRRLGAAILVTKHQFGLMSSPLVLESMTLFAQAVLPELRGSC
jgi:alkanesulfonate monooxygenase SsuD/methylene tetrahydromethanopterin reductase-like flavin-dependent oxidoreductase (luciferase family)